MKKFSVIFILLPVSMLMTEIVFAKMAVPGRTRNWVNDYAGIIDKGTRDYLENLISSIEQKTPDPIEVVIATFKSLDGWRFEDFALEYGEKWRAIKKGRRDNGVILLVALHEGRTSIGVGRNLKGILKDSVVKNIMQTKIMPEFSRGNYAEGIKKGTEAIVDILTEAEIPQGALIFTPRNLLMVFLIIPPFLFIRFIRKQLKRR